MNKQELIEHIGNTLDKYLKNTIFVKPVLSITEIANSNEVSLEFEIDKNCIMLDDVSYQFGYDKGKLDGEWVGQQLKDADKIRLELNKPVVPQFVADEIDRFKKSGDWDLFQAMDYSFENNKTREWLEVKNNQEIFARAWLDGYRTEEEKRYLVRVKNILTKKGVLNRNKISKSFFFSNPEENSLYDTKFTREELEQAGFGWVFECPGIEIEEVEE